MLSRTKCAPIIPIIGMSRALQLAPTFQMNPRYYGGATAATCRSYEGKCHWEFRKVYVNKKPYKFWAPGKATGGRQGSYAPGIGRGRKRKVEEPAADAGGPDDAAESDGDAEGAESDGNAEDEG
jgi:hypothetical protein